MVKPVPKKPGPLLLKPYLEKGFSTGRPASTYLDQNDFLRLKHKQKLLSQVQNLFTPGNPWECQIREKFADVLIDLLLDRIIDIVVSTLEESPKWKQK